MPVSRDEVAGFPDPSRSAALLLDTRGRRPSGPDLGPTPRAPSRGLSRRRWRGFAGQSGGQGSGGAIRRDALQRSDQHFV